MNIPSDTWLFEGDGLPEISVKAERVLLDGGGSIDVLDVVIPGQFLI
jgi:hypothetical protein